MTIKAVKSIQYSQHLVGDCRQGGCARNCNDCYHGPQKHVSVKDVYKK